MTLTNLILSMMSRGMKLEDYALDDYYVVSNYMRGYRGSKTHSGFKKKGLLYKTEIIQYDNYFSLTYHNNTLVRYYPDYNQYFNTDYINHISTSRRYTMTGLHYYKKTLHRCSPLESVYLCSHVFNSEVRVLENNLIIPHRFPHNSSSNSNNDISQEVKYTENGLSRLKEYFFDNWINKKSWINKNFSLVPDNFNLKFSVIVNKVDRHSDTVRWLANLIQLKDKYNLNLVKTSYKHSQEINEILKNEFFIPNREINYGIINFNISFTPQEFLVKFKEKKDE